MASKKTTPVETGGQEKLVKQVKKKLPTVGFHTNPERINRKGRPPKDWCWSDILENVANEINPKTGKQYKEEVARRVWKKASTGDMNAVKELFNRMDGLPSQHIDHTSKGEAVNIALNWDTPSKKEE